MSEKAHKDHIVIHALPISEEFSPRVGGGSKLSPFQGNRLLHGKKLTGEYENAIKQQQNHADSGYRITFLSFPGEELPLSSLEKNSDGEPHLLSSYEEKNADSDTHLPGTTRATIYVPKKRKGYIEKKLQRYTQDAADGKNKLRNSQLVERISAIRPATVRDLWTDATEKFPADDKEHWWEVWLVDSTKTTFTCFQNFVEKYHLQTSGPYLGFSNCSVILVKATINQFEEDNNLLGVLAELRSPQDTAKFIENLTPVDQKCWVDDVLSRTTPAGKNSPTVCILDGGIQREHPLLVASLSKDAVLSARPGLPGQNWLPYPPPLAVRENAHGTEMAGLALYGDLDRAVQSNGPIKLNHRLESVRILPRQGANDPSHYASITASATKVIEESPQGNTHNRTYMMAVTSDKHDDGSVYSEGQPTSWSSAIDALSFGQSIEYQNSEEHFAILTCNPNKKIPRLFIISAGNINLQNKNYTDINPHDESDTEPIGNPAQAWNALTVGAYASDDKIPAKPIYKGYSPVSKDGDLLATSRTSVMFNGSCWPVKPDVVAPGGNYMTSPTGTLDFIPSSGILTTKPVYAGSGFFTLTKDTSAATAQVAAIAASIQAKYPQLRPETVRALIVHSAEWTEEMRKQFNENAETCLRRYGMGVPNAERALYCASNSPTLITESKIRPFWDDPKTKNHNYTSHEMNIHQLPWPEEVLESLGNSIVRLRLTLSYFIEPNPSRRGWKGRYAYPSFGLRFALQRQNETINQLRSRLNGKAPNSGNRSAKRAKEHFILSDKQEHAPGSIHSCIWEGPAIDIAHANAVAIYPTAGWWKERPQFDQSQEGVNYSLIMSLQTEATNVDLWTPIREANAIASHVVASHVEWK